MLSKVLLTVVGTLFSMKEVSSSAIELNGRQLGGVVPPLYTYDGCYSDPSAINRLCMYSGGRNNTMTPDDCIKRCGDKYRYYAVENGDECWCDWVLKTASGGGAKLNNDTKCDKTCAGAPAGSNVKCGGSGTANVYINTAVPPSAVTLAVNVRINNTDTTWAHQSCYQDTTNGTRVLDNMIIEPNSDGTTAALCAISCGARGYTYAGLEYGRECWCGNKLNYITPSNECNQACEKGPREICGGKGALTTYMLKFAV